MSGHKEKSVETEVPFLIEFQSRATSIQDTSRQIAIPRMELGNSKTLRQALGLKHFRAHSGSPSLDPEESPSPSLTPLPGPKVMGIDLHWNVFCATNGFLYPDTKKIQFILGILGGLRVVPPP